MELFELNDKANGVDWSDMSTMKELTCVHHPTAQYLTKNPWQRGLHFIEPCVEAPVEGWPFGGFECPCPFSDLRVVVGSGRYEKEETCT
jgi:hypothetical protein